MLFHALLFVFTNVPARHRTGLPSTLPRLARQEPVATKRYTEKLTKDFQDLYSKAHSDLKVISVAMGARLQIDDVTTELLHDTVTGIRPLRYQIRDSREYSTLDGLIDSINDIEQWLSFSPPRHVQFSDDLKDAATNATQFETEKKVRIANNGFWVRHPDVQQVAEQDAEHLHQQRRLNKQQNAARREKEWQEEEEIHQARLHRLRDDAEKREAAVAFESGRKAQEENNRQEEQIKKLTAERNAAAAELAKFQAEETARRSREAESAKIQEQDPNEG
ncbi:hypothetical protein EJ02DRAFT_424004 [Clathrospora elynae]|uniref:Uncharacterized protein n=1 Tax=Clathrospora elynae TaxID=706981 RepID=A0A6A5SKY5_9PLEO|nr:hypothetical protein EJ02DRAFT_424004 [Clathrospora elynae]